MEGLVYQFISLKLNFIKFAVKFYLFPAASSLASFRLLIDPTKVLTSFSAAWWVALRLVFTASLSTKFFRSSNLSTMMLMSSLASLPASSNLDVRSVLRPLMNLELESLRIDTILRNIYFFARTQSMEPDLVIILLPKLPTSPARYLERSSIEEWLVSSSSASSSSPIILSSFSSVRNSSCLLEAQGVSRSSLMILCLKAVQLQSNIPACWGWSWCPFVRP